MSWICHRYQHGILQQTNSPPTNQLNCLHKQNKLTLTLTNHRTEQPTNRQTDYPTKQPTKEYQPINHPIWKTNLSILLITYLIKLTSSTNQSIY